MALAYFHNDSPYTGTPEWRHSYDYQLLPLEDDGWRLVEPNGLTKDFTYADGFVEVAGYFDKLYISANYSNALSELTVERKNGTRLIFASLDPAAEDPIGPDTPIGVESEDPPLLLRQIVDRNGNAITLHYGTGSYAARLNQVTDPTGRNLNFSYNGATTTITDPSGQTWTVSRGSAAEITSIVNTPATTSPATSPSSRTFSFTYNTNHTIAAMRDWKTNATRTGQNASDTTYSYTYNSGVISRVDGPSWLTANERPATAYSFSGNPQTTTIGQKTGYTGSADTFSTTTQLYLTTGELGTVTKWMGSSSSQNDPHTDYTYTDNHLPAGMARSTGGEVNIDYVDTSTGDISKVYPMGTVNGITYTYSDANNPHLPTLVNDMWGWGTIYKYDPCGNLTDVWDANHTAQAPDPADDADPDLTRLHTHYKVDSHGQIFAASNTAVRAYTLNSQDTDADPMPNQWRYHYDSHGNLDKVWRPNGTPSGTWYSTTTPDQTAHYISALSRRDWSKKSSTDAQVNFHYDGYERLKGIDIDNTAGDEITYSYDENHLLAGMVDPTGATSWTLDALNRVTQEGKDSGTLGWTYRADGQLNTFTNRDNVTTAFTYTDGGLLDTATGPWGTGNPVEFLHRECACSGNVDGVNYPGDPGIAWRNAADAYGGSHGGIYYERDSNPQHEYNAAIDPQLFWEKIHTLTLNEFGQDPSAVKMIQSSGPDNLSRVEMFSDTVDPLHRTTDDEVSYVTYFDPQNPETQTLGDAISTRSYTFDDTGSPGNRYQVRNAGNSLLETYSFDSLGRNRLDTVAYPDYVTDYYSYDAAGNVSDVYSTPSVGDRIYTSDALNHLASIQAPDAPGYGRVQFVFDGLGRLAQVKDDYGTLIGRFYYAGNRLVYQDDGQNYTSVSYQWAGGRLLSQQQNSAIFWYLLDTRGDVVALVDASNNLAAHYVYDAFGQELQDSFEGDEILVPNPLRYRGNIGYMQVFQSSEGPAFSLYNVGARTYHTGTGRWMQEDPLLGFQSDPLSFNRYLYCNADPVLASDPSGLAPFNYGMAPSCFGSFVPCNPNDPADQPPGWWGYVGAGAGVSIGAYGLGMLGISAAAAAAGTGGAVETATTAGTSAGGYMGLGSLITGVGTEIAAAFDKKSNELFCAMVDAVARAMILGDKLPKNLVFPNIVAFGFLRCCVRVAPECLSKTASWHMAERGRAESAELTALP
ncbi:MAG TPA: RHS repeat-associated core domain-containing protein [Armatimonadota bacterium]